MRQLITFTRVSPSARCVLIGLLCGLFFVAGCTESGNPRFVEECSANSPDRIDDPNVKSPNVLRFNINKSQHYEVPLDDAIKLEDMPAADRPSWRRNVLTHILQTHVETMTGRWYADADLTELISDPSQLYDNLINRTGDTAPFFKLYDQKAYSDCRTGTYHYLVTILIPNDGMLTIPEEVRYPIVRRQRALARELVEALRKNDRININTLVFFEILKEPELIREVLEAIQNNPEFEKILDRLDPATREIFAYILDRSIPVKSFASSSYTLSGGMRLTIQSIVEAFLQERDQGLRYKITCEGFADSNPINEPIPYFGSANLRLMQGQAAAFPAEVPASINARFEEPDGNLELSIARGFNAAEVVNKVLDAALSGDERRSVEVYYAGQGVIRGTPQAAYRRIDLTITKQN